MTRHGWLALWLWLSITLWLTQIGLAQVPPDLPGWSGLNRPLAAPEGISLDTYSPLEAVPALDLNLSLDYKLKLNLWLGAKGIRHEGMIQVDGNVATGTKLNLQNELKLPSDNVGLIGGGDLYFLLGDRLSLHCGVDVSIAEFAATTVSGFDWQLGDQYLPAGAAISSLLRYNFYRLHLGYTIYPDPHWGFGFHLCVEYLRLDYAIKGVSGPMVAQKAGDIELLLPLTGIHFDWLPTERWFLTLSSHRGYSELFDRNYGLIAVTTNIRFFPSPFFYLFVRGEWEFDDFKLTSDRNVDIDVDLYSTWTMAGGVGIRF